MRKLNKNNSMNKYPSDINKFFIALLKTCCYKHCWLLSHFIGQHLQYQFNFNLEAPTLPLVIKLELFLHFSLFVCTFIELVCLLSKNQLVELLHIYVKERKSSSMKGQVILFEVFIHAHIKFISSCHCHSLSMIKYQVIFSLILFSISIKMKDSFF